MDIKYHQKMLQLRQHTSQRENVVGWFSVGENQSIDESTTSVHNFYGKTKESKFQPQPQMNFTAPVYLQVDTELRESEKPIGIQVGGSSAGGTRTSSHPSFGLSRPRSFPSS